MFGSVALEVGIGLIFVYLILGLVCTAINEHISQLLSLRAEMLWCSIRQMLGDATAQKVYGHHLVRSLVAKNGGTAESTETAGDLDKPSYITSDVFALAFMDVAGLTPASASAAPISPLTALQSSPLPDTVKQALTPLFTAAGADVDKARAAVEGWYVAAMNRATGWYKQIVQRNTIVVAFLVCWAANADSVSIAQRLWTNPTDRARIVSAADAARQQPAAQPATEAKLPALTPEMRTDSEFLLGWGRDAERFHSWRWKDPASYGWLLSKLLGILITAYAVSLGAPFWFDTLGKVMNARASLKPQCDGPGSGAVRPVAQHVQAGEKNG